MKRYVLNRFMISIGTIFLLLTITFFLTRCMPGSPFQTENVSDKVLTAIQEKYGLDKPVVEQYFMYLKHFIRGDLGLSYKKQGVRVTDVIGRATPVTFLMGILAFILSLTVGMALGILQSMTKRRFVSRLILLWESLCSAIPNFVIALILMLLFGVRLRLLPISGIATPFHYILPILALSAYPMSQIAKYTNRMMKTEMKKNYVLFARTKGMPEMLIIRRHVLRNIAPGILHFTSPMIAFLLTGSFVVESIYTIPGLGREFVNAIGNRDYTMIMGLTVFMGTVVIVIQFLFDIACAWMDPRVRLSMQNRG